ncbi:MAG: patatin-like phospholipase family protein [candidate division WOR-3 bacterium]|nr:MAG: patatin-like phospholipase family protein [candidate division WOR-3 bacterium]
MLGLVLGGGAAKGYAHIGALKVLEEKSIKPDIIVGASMGALVGGFYAAGFDAEKLEEIATKVDKKTKRRLFMPRLSKRGFIDGRNVVKHLSLYLGRQQIEDLPITYAAVATDIENEAEIVIDQGDLVQAIRASISIPVVFMPQRCAGRLLIDGGFVNPLPISVAQKLGAKKIIAVNVLRKIEYPRFEISPVVSPHRSYNMQQVFLETFELITSRLIDYEVRHLKNGIVVNIDTKGIGMSQFEEAQKAIDRGYEETKNVDFTRALG